MIQSLHCFFELQWSVIHRRWQSKTMFYQGLLSASVSGELTVQLRYRHMAFVDHEQIIFRKIIQQCKRRFARVSAVNVHRVVFDAVAVADFFHHFKIEHRAHSNALSFKQFILGFENLQSVSEFNLYLGHRDTHSLFSSDIVSRRKYDDLCQIAQ